MENRLYTTLNRYFKRLSQVGYIPDNDMLSVLVLSYITEVEESITLSPEEQSIIDRVIACLQGTCLIPYEECKGTCIQ